MSDFPLRIILPLLTPSLNEYLSMHYIQRWKLGQQYQWELIAVGANEERFKVEWRERRKVGVLAYRKRLLDYDNFVGGVKPLIDALEGMGLIFLDNPTYLESEYSQVSGGPGRTEITIGRAKK